MFLELISIFACIAVNDLVSGDVLDSSEITKIEVFERELKCPTAVSNLCTTPECVRTATSVLNDLKPSIRPCDNFYQFACGSYLDETEISAHTIEVNRLEDIYKRIPKQLKTVITEDRPKMDPKYLKLPNALYKACMNVDLIDKLDDKPMQRVATALGGWPVIVGESWNKKSWSWQNTVSKCRGLGIDTNFIMKVSIQTDLYNDLKHIIHVGKPSLNLVRSEWNSEFLVSDYYDYMVDMAVLFGAERKVAETELKESLEFERKLAKITKPKDKKSNLKYSYNLRSVKEVQKDYNYMNWLNYIRALLPKGLTVNENEIINLTDFHFFEDLGKLLEATKIRTIANYMFWRIYQSMIPFLSKNFRDRKSKYELSKQKEWMRSKECIEVITDGNENSLWIAISSLYVRKYFNKDSKDVALGMMKSIRDSFIQMVDKAMWMDRETKWRAKKILQSNTSVIGFPDELLHHDKLEGYYRKLHIDPNAYFDSILNKNIMDTDYSFNKLRPLEKDEWMKYANPFDAIHHYLPTKDKLQYSAVLWQDIFFNRHRPMYMNYGAIGATIAHNLARSLDRIDQQYDNAGNFVAVWPPITEKAFSAKVNCLVRQYNLYNDKITGSNVNGVRTCKENMADNIGIRQSYLAYNQWVKKHGAERQLPGLNYTAQQMFWISRAQAVCTKVSKDYALELIAYDTPAEFKIIGSFSNIEEFSIDFGCPKDSPMNPKNKCQSW